MAKPVTGLKQALVLGGTAAAAEVYNRAQSAKGGDVSGARAFEVLLGLGLVALTPPGDLLNTIGAGALTTGVAGMLSNSG